MFHRLTLEQPANQKLSYVKVIIMFVRYSTIQRVYSICNSKKAKTLLKWNPYQQTSMHVALWDRQI